MLERREGELKNRVKQPLLKATGSLDFARDDNPMLAYVSRRRWSMSLRIPSRISSNFFARFGQYVFRQQFLWR